jgi:predicted Zn-dependent peptidase
MKIIDGSIPLLYQAHEGPFTSIRFLVNAGSEDEAAGDYGTAHFLEHMFFKGTERRGYKEVNLLTARLGNINASTGMGRTDFYINCLNGDFDEAFALLREMVFEPSLPQDELEKEIGVIVEEMKTRNASPSTFFWDRVFESLLDDDRWHSTAGTEDSVRSMTRDRINDFRHRCYRPAYLAVSIVGGVAPVAAMKAIKSMPFITPNDRDREPLALSLRPLDFHHSSKQAIVGMVTPSVTLAREFALGNLPDVFANGFGQGMHSLLFDRLREELGLCYSVHAWACAYKDLGVFLLQSMLDQANIDQALGECRALMARVCDQGFPDELLRVAKRNYLFGSMKRFETAGGIGSMAGMFFDVSPEEFVEFFDIEERQRSVEALTNADVIEFARLLFADPDKIKTLTMTPEAA